MQSRAKFMGHAIHPVLVMFPLGLLLTSVLFDFAALVLRGGRQIARSSFHIMGVGVVSGLAAASFGLIDWLGIRENTRAKRIGLWHGVGNGIASLVFGASWLLRREDPQDPPNSARFLSLIGACLLGITGWLGGELVERLGVGIDPGANLNAPNSLTGQPASEPIEEMIPDGLFS